MKPVIMKKRIYSIVTVIFVAILLLNIKNTFAFVQTPQITIKSITGSLGNAGTQNDPFECYTPLNNPDEYITFTWVCEGLFGEYEIRYQITGHSENSAGHETSISDYASNIATKIDNNIYTITVYLWYRKTPFDEWYIADQDSASFWINKKDASISLLLNNYDYVKFPKDTGYIGDFQFKVSYSDYIKIYLEDKTNPWKVLYAGVDYNQKAINTISINCTYFTAKKLPGDTINRYTYWVHKIKLENFVNGVKTDQDSKSFYMAYNFARRRVILVAFNPGKWDNSVSPVWRCRFRFYIEGQMVASVIINKNQLYVFVDPYNSSFMYTNWQSFNYRTLVEVKSVTIKEKLYYGFTISSLHGDMHENFNDPDVGYNEPFDPVNNKDGVLYTETQPTYNTEYDFGIYSITFKNTSYNAYAIFNVKIWDLFLIDPSS